ncbi:MAG: hypothetical protein PHD39_00445 [Methylobacter tundripaludum]|nr:hypothetical protein [Methylobacter tundripaludum]
MKRQLWPVSVILLDIDDVLINVKKWRYEAVNKVLSLFGMKIGRDDRLVNYDGLPAAKKLNMLALERGFSMGQF